jgi:hypothetical protein
MDFGLVSAKNWREEDANTELYDIASLLIKHHSRCDFGLSLQGLFVRSASVPTSHNSIAAKSAGNFNDSFDHVNFNDNVLFGPSVGFGGLFSSAVHGPGLEAKPPVAGYSQTIEGCGNFDLAADASLGADIEFHSSAFTDVRTPSTTVDHSSAQLEPASFSKDFEENAPNDVLQMDLNVEASFSPDFSLTTSGPDDSPPSSFDHHTRTPDLASLDTSPNTSPIGRHICRLCRSNFKRAGDLRRHSRVHYPEQRSFHCSQPLCNRKGTKGFYRRDKLRTHQRQVHNM